MAIGWMNGWLEEGAKIVNVEPPKDQTGAAMVSLYVNLKNWKRCTFIISTGVLTSTDAMAVTLEQATSGAAAGSKALAFDEAWKSVGQSQTADSDALVAVTVASNTFSIADTDDNGIFIVSIRDDMLDINNGFAWVTLKIGSPGAHACLLGVTAILYAGDNAGKPTTLPTAVG